MTTKPAELVIAKFDYKAADSHELGIQKGERLTVLDDTQKWWRVMNAQGATGYVPSNYVKRSKQSTGKRPISSQGGQTSAQNGRHEHSDSQRFPPSVPQPEVSETPTVGLLICQALFAYPANQPDELSIERGDRIQVVEKSSDGWWRGVLVDQDRQSRMGWFPSNYVTLDLSKNLARSKTTAAHETTMNSVPGVHPSQASLPVPSAPVTGQTALQSDQMFPSASKPVTIVERVLTLYPFTRNQNEELSFDTNEVLEIIEKPPDDPDWWRCRNARGETGLVPRNYVSLLPSGPAPSLGEHAVPQDTGQFSFPVQPTEPGQSSASEELRLTYAVSSTTTHAHMEQPWFWGSISRAECESMLTRFAKPGEFVIRDSESHPGDLTVTMNAGSKARNFKVRMERGQYHIGQKVFPSVNELIQHYRTHPIFKNESEKLYLTRPFVHPGRT